MPSARTPKPPRPVYDGGAVVLYRGDARAVLATLPKDSATIALTDPPYTNSTRAGARTNPSTSKAGPAPFAIGYDDLRGVLVELGRVAQRWVIGTFDRRHVTHLEERTPYGLRFVQAGVWVKPDSAPQFNGRGPAPGWEGIAILHRAGRPLVWNGGGGRAVYTHNVERKVDYPTAKPLGLYLELLSLFAKPGDVVIDPFAGSGTAALAARALGMRAVLIERTTRGCDVTVDRLESPAERVRASDALSELRARARRRAS
jgi:hypothetical protein